MDPPQGKQKEVQVAEAALAKLEKQEEAVEVAVQKVGAVIDREALLAAAAKEAALQKLAAEVGGSCASRPTIIPQQHTPGDHC